MNNCEEKMDRKKRNQYRVVPNNNTESRCEVEACRKKLHLSRSQAADLLGVPYKSFANWEDGTVKISSYLDKALTHRLESISGKKKLEKILRKLNVAEIDANQNTLIEWLETMKNEIRACV